MREMTQDRANLHAEAMHYGRSARWCAGLAALNDDVDARELPS
jgi:hypothetical protein